MITREFDLMLYQEGNLLFINANQYDSGEQWIFTLYEENGVKYTPATGAIVGVKSDGKGIINTGTVDEYGRVVINETQQMTAAAGLATFELLIDNDTHGTANFKVDVEPRPADNADLSDSDLSLIQEAIDSAEVIVEVIGDDDPSEVIGEHVDEWLDNHPEATTTVLDGAITAPKINSTLWDKLLVSEEASGAVASFDDGADDVPVSSLKVTLEPIQTGSGDPSPSNIRPIYPANGKNKFPYPTNETKTNNGITVVAENGVYKVTGTATSTATIYFDLPVSIDMQPSVNKIAFNNNVANASVLFYFYNDSTYLYYWSMNTLNRVVTSWTGSSGNIVNRFSIVVLSGITIDITIAPVVMDKNIIDTSYVPYQSVNIVRTGKNILDQSKVVQGSISGTGVDTTSATRLRTPFIKVKPSTKYALQCNNEVQLFEIHEYDANNEWRRYTLVNATSYIYTSGANAHYIKFLIRYSDNSTILPSALTAGMVEEGDTVSEYEPFIGNTYPYTLGQSVYGGTVDLATGAMTVDMKKITLTADMNWQYSSATDRFFVVINDAVAKSGDLLFAGKCNMFKSATGNDDNSVSYINQSANGFAIKHSVLGGSLTAWKQFITNNTVEVVYELATHTTIQLTPTQVNTLLGYNNISSTGTVDVIYHADTKLYVDKMTAVDNNIIAPTEEGFTATRNYTVNDLVIVNDTLYKVTSNIQNGGTITPNSNVQQTTLSALIKALS